MKKQPINKKKNTTYPKQTSGAAPHTKNKETISAKKGKTAQEKEPEIKGKDIDLMNYTDL